MLEHPQITNIIRTGYPNNEKNNPHCAFCEKELKVDYIKLDNICLCDDFFCKIAIFAENADNELQEYAKQKGITDDVSDWYFETYGRKEI